MVKKLIKKILTITFLLLCIFKIGNIITNIRKSDSYNIIYDPFFSESMIIEIQNFINNNLKGKFPCVFHQTLKKQFPIIQSITWRRKHQDFINVSLRSINPLYKINNDLVFSKDNDLMAKETFADSILNSLDQIIIKEEPCSELTIFLNKIPANLTNDYQITWESKNKILLHNKCDNNFSILITHNTLLNEKTLQMCKKIEVENRNEDSKKKFTADLRFTNQIILSQI